MSRNLSYFQGIMVSIGLCWQAIDGEHSKTRLVWRVVCKLHPRHSICAYNFQSPVHRVYLTEESHTRRDKNRNEKYTKKQNNRALTLSSNQPNRKYAYPVKRDGTRNYHSVDQCLNITSRCTLPKLFPSSLMFEIREMLLPRLNRNSHSFFLGFYSISKSMSTNS